MSQPESIRLTHATTWQSPGLVGIPRTTRQTKTTAEQRVTDIDDNDATDSLISQGSNAVPKAEYPQKSHSRKPARLVWQRWWPDIVAIILAILSFAAILIILATQNGKVLPKWPWGISVNAVVSIFATSMKAGVLCVLASAISQSKWTWFRSKPRPLIDIETFDSASRGPLGSFTFLYTVRYQYTATVAAIVTILSIASDPFFQQVVRYQTCRVVDTNALSSASYTPATTNYTGGWTNLKIDRPMQAAVAQGLYGISSPLESFCSSGNCTYPDIRTLGYCSSCKSVSKEITRQRRNSTSSGDDSLRFHDSYWTLGGLNLTYQDFLLESIPMEGVPNDPFHATRLLVTTEAAEAASDSYPDTGPRYIMGVECQLNICVQTLSTTVEQGRTKTNITSTHPTTRKSTNQYPSPAPTRKGQVWVAADMNTTMTATPMPCLLNGTYHPATSFTVPNATHSIPVGNLLPDNATAYLPSACVFNYPYPLGTKMFLNRSLSSGEYSMWVEGVSNEGNATVESLGRYWGGLADAMTIAVRRDGGMVVGETWEVTACITVAWWWLVFPGVLLGGAVGVLVAAVWEGDGEFWKETPLALLFHGFDGREGGRGELRSVEGMREVARKVRVRVGEDDHGEVKVLRES